MARTVRASQENRSSTGCCISCTHRLPRVRVCATRQKLRLTRSEAGARRLTPGPPGAGTRTTFLQPAVRRPLSRLMTSTTNPTTSSKWIRPPPRCKLKPRSHRIRSTTKMVQSMSTSIRATLLFVFLFGFSFPFGYSLGFCSANFRKERLGCGWSRHFA